MISAYAKAGFILGQKEYITIAKTAANFILKNLYKDKRLFRSYKDGKAKINAYLDDYAFFIAALLDLYEATSEIKWIKSAIKLDQVLEEHYEDKKSGVFFMTSNDHEKLLKNEDYITYPFLLPKFQAIVSGGVNAMPIIPLETFKGENLFFHVGVHDMGSITGEKFKLDEYKKVAQFIFMGEFDDNDTLLHDDAYWLPP